MLGNVTIIWEREKKSEFGCFSSHQGEEMCCNQTANEKDELANLILTLRNWISVTYGIMINVEA